MLRITRPLNVRLRFFNSFLSLNNIFSNSLGKAKTVSNEALYNALHPTSKTIPTSKLTQRTAFTPLVRNNQNLEDFLNDASPEADVLCVPSDPKESPQRLVYKRSQIAQELGLSMRDIRLCNPAFEEEMFMFGVREGSILLKMGTLNGFIKHDRMILFEPESLHVRTVASHVWRKWKEWNVPDSKEGFSEEVNKTFEFLCLQTATKHVLSDLHGQVDETQDRVARNLHHQSLSDSILSVQLLHETLLLKSRLHALEVKIMSMKQACKNVLTADEDMAAMYLSDIAQGGHRAVSDHEDVEQWFEIWYQMLQQLQLDIDSMRANILHQEELTRLHLDSTRNEIMQLELRSSLLMCCLTIVTLTAGLFGMNLKSFLEDSNWFFWTLFVGSWVSAVVMYVVVGRHFIHKGLLKPMYKDTNLKRGVRN
eukprot:Platyproteum_vivax@DN4636_c0_g1_i1.p1